METIVLIREFARLLAMSNRHSNKSKSSRRSVLKSAAASGALALSPVVAGAESSNKLTKVTERGTIGEINKANRTLTIRTSKEGHYSFSVTGKLTAIDAPIEAITSGSASASISSETHKFKFSGEFAEFSINGTVEALVDGEIFEETSFTKNTLTLIPEFKTEVSISASGHIESQADNINQPNPRTVSGEIVGRTTFSYAGELTYFEGGKGIRTIEKNGEYVSQSDVLPSRLPGEVRIAGSREQVNVHTSDNARVKKGISSSVEDGIITGKTFFTDVIARYDGNVERVEHENGAKVEIRPSSKRLVCKAPEDANTTFSVEASEAIVADREAHSRKKINVGAGESKRIKYFGSPTEISIGEVDVSIEDEAHEDATNSAKLQRAAVVERTNEFEMISEAIEGRIQHDAESIYLGSVTDGEARDSVAFQVTDLKNGDRGLVNIHRNRSTGKVESAGYEIQWREGGYPEKVEVKKLQTGRIQTNTGETFITEIFNRGENSAISEESGENEPRKSIFETENDVERVNTSGPEPQLLPSIPSWIPSIPSPGEIIDFFGDKLDSFVSGIGIAKDTASEIISSAIEKTEESIEDVMIKGGALIADSQVVLIELIAEAQDKLPKGKLARWVMKLKPGFASSLLELGTSGALDELQNGNYGCGGCIGVISLIISVGLAGGAALTCTLLGMTTFFAGGVACTALIGALLEIGNAIDGPQARDICSGDHRPYLANFC